MSQTTTIGQFSTFEIQRVANRLRETAGDASELFRKTLGREAPENYVALLREHGGIFPCTGGCGRWMPVGVESPTLPGVCRDCSNEPVQESEFSEGGPLQAQSLVSQ